MSKKIIFIVLMLVVVALISLHGKTGELTGSITIAGSTSVQPLAEELAQFFMQKNPHVQIFVQGGGSSAGIKAALLGTADIGNSSRNLRPSEQLYATTIALDGIAIVVNPNNQLDGMTLQQVQEVFSGEVTSWENLGVSSKNLRNKNIVLVNRETGSGTRGAFEELVMEPVNKSLTVNALVQAQNGSVQQVIRTTEAAIGYLSLGFLDGVKPLKINRVAPTVENIINGSYKIARPFLMTTKEKPAGLVKEFLDFILSTEGQQIIVNQGYISVQ